jgi:Glycosyl transferase family group 2
MTTCWQGVRRLSRPGLGLHGRHSREREVRLPRIPEQISLSVVVPATDTPATIDDCIRAIQSAVHPPEELIVVDAPRSAGPAAARNLGAWRAKCGVVVFVDADVVVHPDAFDRIRGAFAADPGLAAIFGSYDADPKRHGLVSDFRNLLHHHVHQAGAGPATTFWAGLGAVRRDDFLSAGGFDEGRFLVASVEDIELGMRLARRGKRIMLDPSLQGKHLKRWTLGNMIRTDLARRGVPWLRLMMEDGASSDALNLGLRHRASAATSLVLAVGLVARRPRVVGVAGLVLISLNASFYALLLRTRGRRQAAAGLPLHALHHLISVAAVPIAVSQHALSRTARNPDV